MRPLPLRLRLPPLSWLVAGADAECMVVRCPCLGADADAAAAAAAECAAVSPLSWLVAGADACAAVPPLWQPLSWLAVDADAAAAAAAAKLKNVELN